VSPTHRRPDGTNEVGTTWESLVERQIREAMEDGRFDELPHQGTALPLPDDVAAGEWAMAHRLLRDAGMAPPWIEADKAVREGLARVETLVAQASRTGPAARERLRRRLAAEVAETNRAIERVNAEAPTTRQHRRRVDPDEAIARLEDAFPD
jgi:Domain of unknown function (DUF1992)